jgi:hypothetical protein
VLYGLVEFCEYGDLKEEMLRDRIVVGIRDVALSEKLQLQADLTLEKAKKLVRQKEAVQEQHLLLQGYGSKKDPIVLDEVKGHKTPPRKGGARLHPRKVGSQAGSHTATVRPQHAQCKRCGRERHTADRCPARKATCHKCNTWSIRPRESCAEIVTT